MLTQGGRQQMINGSERDNFEGKGRKKEVDFSMKTLTSTKAMVYIRTLEG